MHPLLDRLDELAKEGYDVEIKRLAIFNEWKVDIHLTDRGLHFIHGYGESRIPEDAIQLALEDLYQAKQEFAQEQEKAQSLAAKAASGTKPRLTLT